MRPSPLFKPRKPRDIYLPGHPTPEHWKDISDPLEAATSRELRKLLIEDARIEAFYKQGSRVYLHLVGGGVFAYPTETKAARNFKKDVIHDYPEQ